MSKYFHGVIAKVFRDLIQATFDIYSYKYFFFINPISLGILHKFLLGKHIKRTTYENQFVGLGWMSTQISFCLLRLKLKSRNFNININQNSKGVLLHKCVVSSLFPTYYQWIITHILTTKLVHDYITVQARHMMAHVSVNKISTMHSVGTKTDCLLFRISEAASIP